MLLFSNLTQLLRFRFHANPSQDARFATGRTQNPFSPATRRSYKTRRSGTKLHRKRLGAATVEFAMVAPFIFFIIFGSVEFARMMMVKQALTNAAREGCRHATLATVLDFESAEDVVRNLLTGTIVGSLDPAVVQVSISPESGGGLTSGTELLTLVEVNCADISWIPSTIFAGAKIRGVAFMNRE